MGVNILNECRIEYVVGSFIFYFRWFSRWKTTGFKGFCWEDSFSVFAWIFFSIVFSIGEYLSSAVATPLPQSPDQQSPSSHSSKDDIQQRVEMAFARFFSTTLFSWCLKGCLLMLFLRLKAANPAMTFLPVTQLQKQQTPRLRRYIQTVAGLTVIFYFAIIIMYMLAFNCHGQIPSDAGNQCFASMSVNITATILNVLIDTLLLVVPILALFDIQASIQKKIKTGFLIMLGLVIIGIALGRGILVVRGTESATTIWAWTQREAIVAIFTVNLPIIDKFAEQLLGSGTESPCGCRFGCRYASRKSSTSNFSSPWEIKITRHAPFTITEDEYAHQRTDPSWVVGKSRTGLPFRISRKNSVQGVLTGERAV